MKKVNQRKKIKSKTKIDAKMESIKRQIKIAVSSSLPGGLSCEKALEEFLKALSDSIKVAGEKGKESIIRSQEPIKLFHEVIKAELIKKGVDPSLIFPKLGNTAGEIKLTGYFKRKAQDICVIPKNQAKKPEILMSGMLNGIEDPLGKDYTEKTLVINVRSQMSSIAKNLDTMYERIFAEPLNLHMRCPKIVVGEFYIIPLTGFNMKAVKQNRPEFEPIIITPKNKISKTTAKVLEQYILAFQTVNRRNMAAGEEYKYERVCLLIADFSKNPIKIYSTDAELQADGLLPAGSLATMSGLSFEYFIRDLIQTHNDRFGTGILS